MNKKYIVQPGGQLRGSLRVPGDKSISHRSIMLGSLAEGTTKISGFLESEDTLSTLSAFRAMGVGIDGPINGTLGIRGVGMHGLKGTDKDIYLGNSGTSIRLLSGLLAGQSFDSVLAGDMSLSVRPMRRVTAPLIKMGASIDTNKEGRTPLKINGGNTLTGINYELPMASGQVKSCLLLAGMYAQGTTMLTEPASTRNHTELMLQNMGYKIDIDEETVVIEGGGKLIATTIDIPADISSATFFMVGATIAEGSDITLTGVGINPTRIGVINILRLMGADIMLFNEYVTNAEPVADIRVRYTLLRGINIPEDQVSLAIDEFPAIFVAASCADGETVLTGAEELRVKESDRIQAMVNGLNILGINVESTADGIVIHGGQIGSGEVESYGDHRIAMSFTMSGLQASGAIRINDCTNVATSFPNFISLANQAGLNVNEIYG